MPSERYDVIIIGTGAGGGTVARALADAPARILLLDRGRFVPREPENRDPAAVWKHRRYQTSESWLDGDGRPFRPYMHYCVGGNTKFWGSVLFRMRREDFGELEHVDGVSPAWPFGYDVLEPYYARAERLYEVHGAVGEDPTEAPREPFPHAAVPTRSRWRPTWPASALRGCIPRRCRWGSAGRESRGAASCATRATRSRATATRRATPTSAACAPPPGATTSPCGPMPGSGAC